MQSLSERFGDGFPFSLSNGRLNSQKFMMDADQNNLQNIYTPLTLKKHWVL